MLVAQLVPLASQGFQRAGALTKPQLRAEERGGAKVCRVMLLEPGISGQRVLPPAHSHCPGRLRKFGCFAYLGRPRSAREFPGHTRVGPAGSFEGKAGKRQLKPAACRGRDAFTRVSWCDAIAATQPAPQNAWLLRGPVQLGMPEVDAGMPMVLTKDTAEWLLDSRCIATRSQALQRASDKEPKSQPPAGVGRCAELRRFSKQELAGDAAPCWSAVRGGGAVCERHDPAAQRARGSLANV